MSENEVVPSGQSKECPFCSEDVKLNAKKCKHCGETIDVALRAAEDARRQSNSNTPNVFMNAGGGGAAAGSAAAAASGAGGAPAGAVAPKSKGVAYLLLIGGSFFCLCGLHRFYIGKVGTGILWLLTLGLLGIGQLIDLFTLGHQVDVCNALNRR